MTSCAGRPLRGSRAARWTISLILAGFLIPAPGTAGVDADAGYGTLAVGYDLEPMREHTTLRAVAAAWGADGGGQGAALWVLKARCRGRRVENLDCFQVHAERVFEQEEFTFSFDPTMGSASATWVWHGRRQHATWSGSGPVRPSPSVAHYEPHLAVLPKAKACAGMAVGASMARDATVAGHLFGRTLGTARTRGVLLQATYGVTEVEHPDPRSPFYCWP